MWLGLRLYLGSPAYDHSYFGAPTCFYEYCSTYFFHPLIFRPSILLRRMESFNSPIDRNGRTRHSKSVFFGRPYSSLLPTMLPKVCFLFNTIWRTSDLCRSSDDHELLLSPGSPKILFLLSMISGGPTGHVHELLHLFVIWRIWQERWRYQDTP